jgi:hypothetical protein
MNKLLIHILSLDTHRAFEYFLSGSLGLLIMSYLGGAARVLGCILSVVLLIRALYGLYKDRLDIKLTEIEVKIKEMDLKREENENLAKENKA